MKYGIALQKSQIFHRSRGVAFACDFMVGVPVAYFDICLAFSVHECLGKEFYQSGFLCYVLVEVRF